MTEFAEWDSFYLIVGGAAGALIGLQFVVLTLIANMPRRPESVAGQAFSTPTVLHFCVVLFLSATIRVPWHNETYPAILWAIVGISGIAYATVVVRRMRLQHAYEPEMADWISYAAAPLVAYTILLISALVAASRTSLALFGVGASALLLLFTGIYNAWDTVTFHVFEKSKSLKDQAQDVSESADEI